MKDLESKLKALRLRPPSRNLDDRVLAQKRERPVAASYAVRRVPIWLTAAVALVMALAGFATGAAWRGEQPSSAEHHRSAPVMVHVIYNSPSSGNPFDFTHASDVFPAGKLETKTHIEKGA